MVPERNSISATRTASSFPREFDYAPLSSVARDFEYAPLSSDATSSTDIRYAPLSSEVHPTRSTYHAPTSSHIHSTSAQEIQPWTQLSTSQSATSTSTVSFEPAAMASSVSNSTTKPHTEVSGPSIELTVTTLVLLCMLLTLTVTLWVMEVMGSKQAQKQREKTDSTDSRNQGDKTSLVGLDISMEGEIKDATRKGGRIQAEQNTASCVEKFIEKCAILAVSEWRTEVGMVAEEGLLLSSDGTWKSRLEGPLGQKT